MGRSTAFKGYKVQWAPRKESNPDYPAAPWKTVSGAAHIIDPAQVERLIAELQEEHPDHLFRGWWR